MKIAPVPATREPAEDLAARFAREAEPLFDVLTRGARRLTRNTADAEDLLQDTLLHAFAGFHTFDQGSNLKAWLFRILYNRWVSTFRTKQRRPAEVSVDKVTEHELAVGVARLPVCVRSAESQVLDALPDTQIKAALESLPVGFAASVYYADIVGHTLAETAAILDIPMGTVMSRVARARQRLRVALADLNDRGSYATAEPNIA